MTSSPRPAVLLVHDEGDQARLSVHGDLDGPTTTKLEHYLRAVLDAGARFIVLDLPGASDHDPTLLELVGRTQRELTGRAGMITVVGLAIERHRPADRVVPTLIAV